MEERRLKKLIHELDANAYSTADYFWRILAIDDNGLIRYGNDNQKLTHGVVVGFDRGSTVGVQDNHFEQFRRSKARFLRELYKNGCDFHWREMTLRNDELPSTLIAYYNTMRQMKNKAHKNLLKLQIDINTAYVNDADQRYVDYIVIYSSRTAMTRHLHSAITGIVKDTLGQNPYIINPHILDKNEVEAFFEDVLMIRSVNSDTLTMGKSEKPFSEFAKVRNIIGIDGRERSLEVLKEASKLESAYGQGVSIEKMKEQEDNQKEIKIRKLEKGKKTAIQRLTRDFNTNKITGDDYTKQLDLIEEKFEYEVGRVKTGQDIKDMEAERERARKERELKRKVSEKLTKEIKKVEITKGLNLSVDEDFVKREEELEMKEYLEKGFDAEAYLAKGLTYEEVFELERAYNEQREKELDL